MDDPSFIWSQAYCALLIMRTPMKLLQLFNCYASKQRIASLVQHTPIMEVSTNEIVLWFSVDGREINRSSGYIIQWMDLWSLSDLNGLLLFVHQINDCEMIEQKSYWGYNRMFSYKNEWDLLMKCVVNMSRWSWWNGESVFWIWLPAVVTSFWGT